MHTPGPWAWKRTHLFNDCEVQGLRVRDAAGSEVAVVPRGPVALKRSQEEWEANALLIAAAPDLLRSLEDILSTLSVRTMHDIPRGLLDALDRAEVHVLAAKGELPTNPNDERRLS